MYKHSLEMASCGRNKVYFSLKKYEFIDKHRNLDFFLLQKSLI